jgi:hypothetical protein
LLSIMNVIHWYRWRGYRRNRAAGQRPPSRRRRAAARLPKGPQPFVVISPGGEMELALRIELPPSPPTEAGNGAAIVQAEVDASQAVPHVEGAAEAQQTDIENPRDQGQESASTPSTPAAAAYAAVAADAA